MAGQHSAASGQWCRRVGSSLVIGALPLTVALWQTGVAGAAAPSADSGVAPAAGMLPDAGTVAAGVSNAADAVAHVVAQANPWQFQPSAATDPAVPPFAAPVADAEPNATTADATAPAAAPAAGISSNRNAANSTRALPDLTAPAMVNPGALHMPDLAHPAPPVAPIKAPDGTIRIGSVVTPRPDFIDPQLTAQINDSAAQTEAGLAQTLDSAGFEPSRSDRIAADTLGGAVIGSSVGNIVSSPIASTSAVVGAVAGLIAGVPFLPAGLIVMPIVGAAIGYAVIAAPAAAAGAAIGAGVGAIEGAVAPGVAAPQQGPVQM
ncbi:hypothetical protein [Nocardia africana]|uniref:Uncharacterized protein n=1 Tax=Nocardia africana TaxID=134964 RepID=A0A378X5H5_9NOCA|nr:hypothetical protein [Nocardia africana]MCC3317347.1 hypothetical protein [Nocardia africana]SUA48085.1 Uncharacterised protein [Nocardia africana]